LLNGTLPNSTAATTLSLKFPVSRVCSAWVLLLLVLPSLGVAQPVASLNAGAPGADQLRKHVTTVTSGSLRLARVARDGSPHLIVATGRAGQQVVPPGTKRADVSGFLGKELENLRDLLSLPQSAELRVEGVNHAGHLWHSSVSLWYNNVPVRDRSLNVNIGDQSGKYVALLSDLPIQAPLYSEATLTPDALTVSRLASFIGTGDKLRIEETPQLVYVQDGGSFDLRLAYEATLRDTTNAHLWRLTVDARTGELIERQDLLEYVSSPAIHVGGRIVGRVHPQSPFDSTVIVGLPNLHVQFDTVMFSTDSNGYWSGTLSDTSAPLTVGFVGEFSSVSRADTSCSLLSADLHNTEGLLEWNDANSQASERDAYYSVNKARIFAKQLGTSLKQLDEPTPIFVNLNQNCNAYYDPSQSSLNFFRGGNSCSNTAEIADVVYHEYGHHLLHARYACTSRGNITNSSLNEGFADVFSAFMRDDSRIGIGFFASDPHKTLRDCFNTKVFPRDITGDPHATGQIISGAFWDLRRLLGKATAIQLYSDALALTPDAPNSTNVGDIETGVMSTLMAVLMADDTDNDLSNGTPNIDNILTAFSRHGIVLSNLIELQADRLADQSTAVLGYTLRVRASYDGPIGRLMDSSVTVFYSFDNGQSYDQTQLRRMDDSLFVGVMPKAPIGTMVRYYYSAYTSLANGGSAVYPSTAEPFTFLVGYRRQFADDAEKDNGWSLAAESDKAKTGRWVRDVPYGTYQVPGTFIQQDTDHSPNGVACYVTGNKQTRVFTEDDVDSGATTLTTPAIDLSTVTAPVIRYWYYYWNRYGFYADRAPWVTQISSDDGLTWKTVQNTSSATQGWQMYQFRVSDKVTPTATVRVRFVAADYYATVVEAGVDDFEVLSSQEPTFGAVASTQPLEFSLSLPHPSPVSSDANGVSVSVTNDRTRRALLQLRNTLGDVVRTVVDGALDPGITHVTISTHGLPAGIYWLVLSDGTERIIRRIAIE
jgi:hypothetical protein